jgi:dolichol kinase
VRGRTDGVADLSAWEITCAACFFQFSLYIAVRLAHKAVTLGELTIIVFGATALYMELVNITTARVRTTSSPLLASLDHVRAQIWPISTAYIKTFRLPTPLLIFQIALVPGSLLTGFLLSPLLALSRHLAQQPLRRLKVPNEKAMQRRWLACGFYLGAVLVVGGLIGTWTRWCLGNRDPWLWVLRALLAGPRVWTRPALLAYWAALGSLSVVGWNRQLARSRRLRPRLPGEPALSAPGTPQDTAVGEPGEQSAGTFSAAAAATMDGAGGTKDGGDAVGSMALNLPSVSLPNVSVALPTFGTPEWLDAADRRVPTLGLNGRRKFFHLLAVVMFVPGVAADVAFTHLAFGAAFALFAFAEYVRYFALWPAGAAVHVFVAEFLDAKDGGSAVLSHFYLLTGCASAVWFEAPQRLLAYTGILTVGIGDAVVRACSLWVLNVGRLTATTVTGVDRGQADRAHAVVADEQQDGRGQRGDAVIRGAVRDGTAAGRVRGGVQRCGVRVRGGDRVRAGGGVWAERQCGAACVCLEPAGCERNIDVKEKRTFKNRA